MKARIVKYGTRMWGASAFCYPSGLAVIDVSFGKRTLIVHWGAK